MVVCLVFELFVFVGFKLVLCAGGQQCLERAALMLLPARLGLTVLEHIVAGRTIKAIPVAMSMAVDANTTRCGGYPIALQRRRGGIRLIVVGVIM